MQAMAKVYLLDPFFFFMATGDYISIDDMYGYYATVSPEIVGYLVKRGLDRQTAEDLTHDTFYKACKQVSKGNVKAENVRAWLFRIAHNAVISAHRKKTEIPSNDLVISTGDAQMDEKMLAASIADYVARNFSEREREVFDLRSVQAISFQETAEVLRISKTTVMRIDENNIKRIREQFGEIV